MHTHCFGGACRLPGSRLALGKVEHCFPYRFKLDGPMCVSLLAGSRIGSVRDIVCRYRSTNRSTLSLTRCCIQTQARNTDGHPKIQVVRTRLVALGHRQALPSPTRSARTPSWILRFQRAFPITHPPPLPIHTLHSISPILHPCSIPSLTTSILPTIPIPSPSTAQNVSPYAVVPKATKFGLTLPGLYNASTQPTQPHLETPHTTRQVSPSLAGANQVANRVTKACCDCGIGLAITLYDNVEAQCTNKRAMRVREKGR